MLMKKFILLTGSLMMALCSSAQGYKLCSNGVELSDGQRVNITATHSTDYTDLIFDPKLTLTTTKAGVVNVTLKFASNECSPELAGEDDNLNWLEGVGEPVLQICAPNIVGNCVRLGVDQELSKGKNLAANFTENLMIEQVYTVGMSVKGIEGLTIKSEFELTISQGGETKKVTFYIDTDGASISDIEAGNAPVEYYNILGRRVENPTHGVYIMRRGSKSVKVVL